MSFWSKSPQGKKWLRRGASALSKSEPVWTEELKLLDVCRWLSSKTCVCVSVWHAYTHPLAFGVSFQHRTVCSWGFTGGKKKPNECEPLRRKGLTWKIRGFLPIRAWALCSCPLVTTDPQPPRPAAPNPPNQTLLVARADRDVTFCAGPAQRASFPLPALPGGLSRPRALRSCSRRGFLQGHRFIVFPHILSRRFFPKPR